MNGYQITFFTQQDRTIGNRPLAQWLIDEARRMGCRGATMSGAVEGLGHDGVIHAVKDVSLRNRIAIPPMCMYSANDGLINDWHTVHYATLARGGAGLVVVEATAVAPEGRITPGCAGIWNDELALAFVPVVQSIKAAGAVPGIQIAHAGARPVRTVPGKVTIISAGMIRAAGRPSPHRL